MISYLPCSNKAEGVRSQFLHSLALAWFSKELSLHLEARGSRRPHFHQEGVYRVSGELASHTSLARHWESALHFSGLALAGLCGKLSTYTHLALVLRAHMGTTYFFKRLNRIQILIYNISKIKLIIILTRTREITMRKNTLTQTTTKMNQILELLGKDLNQL